MMTAEKPQAISAGAIAKELGVTDAKVKKALKELGIEPVEKKGVCNLYSNDAVAKVKKALK
jgi:predicted ArsR family transcriptional regulator